MAQSMASDVNGKDTWVKAQRYNGNTMQVGPIADIVVGYAR